MKIKTGQGCRCLALEYRRLKINEMFGCENCRYWIREYDDSGYLENKNRCGNEKFHQAMKENGMKSRRWLMNKKYCSYAKEIKVREVA